MSPRTRRQELRHASGHNSKPYAHPQSSSKTSRSRNKKSHSRQPSVNIPPAVLANDPTTVEASQARNLGMPSRAQYKSIEQEYIASLHPRKQEKALLSQELFDKIWDVLHDPSSPRVGTPQFRWWVRKMFVLSYPKGSLSPAELESLGVENSTPVVLHDNRPVALKDQIYDVLCYCHQLANHGGRDKTTAIIREHYSWIPKELIAQFVKACPTCVFKKTGKIDLALSMNNQEELHPDGVKRGIAMNSQNHQVPAVLPPGPTSAQFVSLPVSDLTGGKVRVPGPMLKGWTPSEPYLVPSDVAHPMPALQSWSSSSYESGNGSWPSHAQTLYDSNWSSGGSPPHAGPSNDPYQLPSMSRALSADEAYRNVPFGHGSRGGRITLPPLMKALSEGMGMQPPMMRPLYNPAGRDGYNMTLSDPSFHPWFHSTNSSGNLTPQEQSENSSSDAPYVPQIDPTLLTRDESVDKCSGLMYPPETPGDSVDIQPPYSVSPSPSPSPEGRQTIDQIQPLVAVRLTTPPKFSRKSPFSEVGRSPFAHVEPLPSLADIDPHEGNKYMSDITSASTLSPSRSDSVRLEDVSPEPPVLVA